MTLLGLTRSPALPRVTGPWVRLPTRQLGEGSLACMEEAFPPGVQRGCVAPCPGSLLPEAPRSHSGSAARVLSAALAPTHPLGLGLHGQQPQPSVPEAGDTSTWTSVCGSSPL